MTHYRFEEYTFQTTNGELAGSEDTQNLRAKTAALLSYLIAHRNRVVGKDELFREVWNDRVVSDATLVQSIQELRKTLGDSARSPRFIRTYPRRGYQWVSDITEIKESEPEVPSPLQKTASGKVRLLLAMVAVLVMALAASLWIGPSADETGTTEEIATSRIKVLIPPFYNDTDRKDLQWLELGLRDLIVSALDKTISMEEVSQVAYFQAALERGPNLPRPDPAALTTMLPELGANYAIHGYLVIEEGDVRFFFEVLNQNGSVLLETVSYAQLLENLPGIVAKIAGAMQQDSTGRDDQQIWSVVAGANDEYLHGLQYRKTRGEAIARVYFEAALQRDTGFNEARLQLALCYYRLGEWQAAAEHYEILLREAKTTNNRTLEADALLGKARVLSHRGSFAESEALVRKALVFVESNGDAYEHAAVLRQLGNMRLLRGYADDQRQLYQQAQDLTTGLDDPLSHAEDLFHLGSSDGVADRSATNKKLLELALQSFEELGDQQSRAYTLLHLGKHRLVPPEQRRKNLETALALFESRGNLLGAAFCLEIMGINQAMILQGEVGIPIMARSLELARKTGARFREADVIYVSGVVAISATIGLEGAELEAMYNKAEAHLIEARGLFGALDLDDRMAACQLVLAMIKAERGHVEEAESLFKQSLTTLEKYQIPEAAAMGRVGKAHLAMRQKKWEEALTELKQANTIFPDLAPLILRLEAHCHYARAAYDQALEIDRARKKLMGNDWQETDELLLGTYAAAAKSGQAGETPPLFSLIKLYFQNR